MPFQSDKRLYLTADKSQVVEEGDASAAYLFVNEGGEVTDEDANRYGLKAPRQADAPTPLDREQEALKLAEERGSEDEADVRRQTIASLEEEDKATRATANKARRSPPEDKSA